MAKRRLKKLLSCVLALNMCMSILSVSAFAEGEEEGGAPGTLVVTTDVTGSGTAEDPTVKTTETKGPPSTDENGNVTTETTTEKEWNGETQTSDEDGDDVKKTTVQGNETTEDTEVRDENGDLLDKHGVVSGSETTTTDPSEKPEDTVPGTDKVHSEPSGEISITLTPGMGTSEKPVGNTGNDAAQNTGTVDMWLDGSVIPDWVSEGTKSERAEDGTITNVTETANADGTKTYTQTITKPDGTKSVEEVTVTYDEGGRVIGYNKTTTLTESVTDSNPTPSTPDQATVGKDGTTTYSYELPEMPAVDNPPWRMETANSTVRKFWVSVTQMETSLAIPRSPMRMA